MKNYNLYTGDNLLILKEHFDDNSVDLIYMDPPFNSNQDYRLLTGGNAPKEKGQSGKVFEDIWHWNEHSEAEFSRLTEDTESVVSGILRGFSMLIGKGSRLAYLMMMTPRLVELRRILKDTGSVYLHCDQHASSHLRIVLDVIFGAENFLNNIIWCYGLGGSSPRYWPRKHDDILWYSRNCDRHYFQAEMIPATSQKMKGKMKKAPDYWFIPTINNMAHERNGYPTQKPEQLLRRIIRSSSREGEVVLDPFCGSGTTLAVACSLGRTAIGIDISDAAINLTRERLERLENISPE